MRLYDTARREIVPFEPGPIVTMYTCGITPYDATHLGHAAVYVTYDVLQRRLRDLGHETRCVRNITDVDDDLLRKARELGVHYLDLAAAEVARFDGDMLALNVIECWSEPRATSAIADIRGFIGMVLDQGYAYESGGSIYFDVNRFDRFGQISHLSRDEMLVLALAVILWFHLLPWGPTLALLILGYLAIESFAQRRFELLLLRVTVVLAGISAVLLASAYARELALVGLGALGLLILVDNARELLNRA